MIGLSKVPPSGWESTYAPLSKKRVKNCVRAHPKGDELPKASIFVLSCIEGKDKIVGGKSVRLNLLVEMGLGVCFLASLYGKEAR